MKLMKVLVLSDATFLCHNMQPKSGIDFEMAFRQERTCLEVLLLQITRLTTSTVRFLRRSALRYNGTATAHEG